MRYTTMAFAALLGILGSTAHASEAFRSPLLGNTANQLVAGFASSVVDWTIERGRASIVPLGDDRFEVIVRTKGLIIPLLGFNPSPDLLARIICHDEAGAPSEAARTQAVPFAPSGDAKLVDVISIESTCFAPIILLTGSVDPQGESPGKFFALTGL